MRYQLELDIDLPRERVLELFLDPESLPKWQPDLVSFEPIGGEPRQVGAKSRQVHRMGGREVEMIETITVRNHPNEFSATYEADNVWNLVENRFAEAGERKTRWTVNSDFRCSGLVGMMAFFLPGMFKRQTLLFMNRFKEFAEKSGG